MGITIGLDLGTTSLSAVAIDDSGRLLKSTSLKHKADVVGLVEGRSEQDPMRIRQAAMDVLRDMVAGLPEPPRALGLTGQMHGVILLDERNRPVSNLITWQDRRSLEPHPVSGESLWQTLLSRVDADAMRRTGCRLSPGYLGTTLYALRETRSLPTTARKAALLVDWLATTLTGGEPVTDPSNAASTGLFDLEQRRWSPELLAAVGIAEEMLPVVRESGEWMGRLTSEVADESGLPVGLPVANAIGDNQAAILGSLPPEGPERILHINVGTGGQISWLVDRFLRVEGMDTRYLPIGRYLLVGAGLAGGDAYAWVQRTVSNWLRTLGMELPEEEVYRRLETAMASAARDADGLICEPFFRGTRQQSDLRGRFLTVTADNFTPGNVARAVLKGIVEAMASFRDAAGDQAPFQANRLIATGNAIRRNPLLVEMLSERFGLPVTLSPHDEEAAFGAALLASRQG